MNGLKQLVPNLQYVNGAVQLKVMLWDITMWIICVLYAEMYHLLMTILKI